MMSNVLIQPFMISHLCHYGSAHEFLCKFPESDPVIIVCHLEQQELTKYEILMIPKLCQVASGMAYLHGRNIIHCDLKAVCAILLLHFSSFIILTPML